MSNICYRWGSTNVKWKDANWKWSECQLVVDILQYLQPGVDASTLLPPWLRNPNRHEVDDVPPWERSKDKKERLIRLICKIQGEEIDESKKVNTDITIKAKDIKIVWLQKSSDNPYKTFICHYPNETYNNYQFPENLNNSFAEYDRIKLQQSQSLKTA